jgi:hypothetical protein
MHQKWMVGIQCLLSNVPNKGKVVDHWHVYPVVALLH